MYVRLELYQVWWWRWLYVPGLMFMASLGFTPDWERVGRVLDRSFRIRAVRVHPEVDA